MAREEGRQHTANRCQLDKALEVEHRRRIRRRHWQVVVDHQKKVQRMITGARADIDNLLEGSADEQTEKLRSALKTGLETSNPVTAAAVSSSSKTGN